MVQAIRIMMNFKTNVMTTISFQTTVIKEVVNLSKFLMKGDLTSLRDTREEYSEDLKCKTLTSEDVEPIVNEDIKALCQKLQVGLFSVLIVFCRYLCG